MLLINKGLEVYFYCAILFLRLGVDLRMESRKESPFDTQEVAQKISELERKHWSLIRNSWLWEAVIHNNYIDDNFY